MSWFARSQSVTSHRHSSLRYLRGSRTTLVALFSLPYDRRFFIFANHAIMLHTEYTLFMFHGCCRDARGRIGKSQAGSCIPWYIDGPCSSRTLLLLFKTAAAAAAADIHLLFRYARVPGTSYFAIGRHACCDAAVLSSLDPAVLLGRGASTLLTICAGGECLTRTTFYGNYYLVSTAFTLSKDARV